MVGWSGGHPLEMLLKVAFSILFRLLSSLFYSQYDSLIAVKFQAYHFPFPLHLL